MARKSLRQMPREKQLDVAASGLMMAIWNIKALIDLIEQVPELHQKRFPDEIAGGIRVIGDMAREADAKYSKLI